MCTVTYLPLNSKEFILTSNRDESILRPSALAPEEYNINNTLVYYPKDVKANGTWFAASKEFTLCLLNGAFEKHTPKEKYRKSRGVILLDFFNFNSTNDFIDNVVLEDIEPFTLIIVDTTKNLVLTELRWDGEHKNIKILNANKAIIWSSVTLYTKETIIKREQWFNTWLLKNKTFTQNTIIDFHNFTGNGNSFENLLLDLGSKRTVSITSFKNIFPIAKLFYNDLFTEQTYNMEISL